jgi:aryl-alcohol dehydrogenase-like predicted oxidoreductase
VRWVLEQPQVASAIVGARTSQQFSETLEISGWRIPEAALQRLNTVSALQHRYPRSMEDGMAARRNKAVKQSG